MSRLVPCLLSHFLLPTQQVFGLASLKGVICTAKTPHITNNQARLEDKMEFSTLTCVIPMSGTGRKCKTEDLIMEAFLLAKALELPLPFWPGSSSGSYVDLTRLHSLDVNRDFFSHLSMRFQEWLTHPVLCTGHPEAHPRESNFSRGLGKLSRDFWIEGR